MNVIQPLVFVFVALVIVLLYAAMFAADLSKYGGPFMKTLKPIRLKPLHLLKCWWSY